MADDKIRAMDERLTQLERRIFGLAEKDAEYPKVRTITDSLLLGFKFYNVSCVIYGRLVCMQVPRPFAGRFCRAEKEKSL